LQEAAAAWKQPTDLLIHSPNRFLLLARHPYIGRRRDELQTGLRSFPVGDYIVFYRITPDEKVLILHVVRGSRNIDELLGS
jgi:toxin ParE1/3/4